MPTWRAALAGLSTFVVCLGLCRVLFALLDVQSIFLVGPAIAIGVSSYAVYRGVAAGSDRPEPAPEPRFLWAYVDDTGRLHIDGQDLGPATAIVSSDGEYEWFETIAAADVPRVVTLLGGQPGDDVLDLLERDFTGTKSYDLEARLRAADIPIDRHTWSG
jgi:hypothetical protein